MNLPETSKLTDAVKTWALQFWTNALGPKIVDGKRVALFSWYEAEQVENHLRTAFINVYQAFYRRRSRSGEQVLP